MVVFSFDFIKGKYIVNNLKDDKIVFNDYNNSYFIEDESLVPTLNQIYNLEYIKELTIVTYNESQKRIGVLDYPLSLYRMINNQSFGESRYFRSSDFFENNDYRIIIDHGFNQMCLTQSEKDIGCANFTSLIYRESFDEVVTLNHFFVLGDEVQINTKNKAAFNEINQFMIEHGYVIKNNKTIGINYFDLMKYSLAYSKIFHISLSLISSFVLLSFAYLFYYFSNGSKIYQSVVNGAFFKSVWIMVNRKILITSLLLICVFISLFNYFDYFENLNSTNIFIITIFFFISIAIISLFSLFIYWKKTQGGLHYEA